MKAEPKAVVLLAGPSGCGSHLLRALAADLGAPCLLADGASFAEIFLGVAAARVRDLFAQGGKQGAAFVGIDGVDDICRSRSYDSRGERDERTQAMLQLASSLDGIGAPTAQPAGFLRLKARTRPAFAFIGVTSRPDLIDAAILRRFARVLTLEPPELEERASILTSLAQAAGLTAGFDLRAAASRTGGWTRGDLRSLVDDLTRRAVGRAPSPVDLDDALAARERVRTLVAADPGRAS